MGEELVRYNASGPVFAEVVDSVASAIHPLLGISKLVARAHAWRIETKRLHLDAEKAHFDHKERIQINALQAHVTERWLDDQREIEAAKIVAQRETSAASSEVALRGFDVDLHRIDREFDVAVGRMRLVGSLRRQEIRAAAAIESARIDADLRAELARMAALRQAVDREYSLQRNRDRNDARNAAEVRSALSAASNLMVGAGSDEYVASVVAQLGHALALMTTRHESPYAAVLLTLAQPQRL